MAITAMTDDLDIIAALDDMPNDEGGLSPSEFKAKFDEGPNAIKDYINDVMIPSTEAHVTAAVAAAEIAAGNMPGGGTTGQILTKASGDDYDYGWETLATSSTPVAASLAKYDANGNIEVAAPTADADASTKKYVDDSIAARQNISVGGAAVAQTPAATTRTYITGSNLVVAAGALKVGTRFRWTMSITKTAAGTAASTYDICFGAAGTTADTARVSFTKAAGSAAIDVAYIVIEAIVTDNDATGAVSGHFNLTHNLATTGHAVLPALNVASASAAFDVAAVTNIGLCVTSGASDALTINLVTAEIWNY